MQTKLFEFGGYSIALSSGDICVYAELVETQPENLPPGLVLIKLPYNCYIDLNKEPEL